VRFELESMIVSMVLPLSLYRVKNHVCLSRGVQVAKFNMMELKPMSTPMSIAMSLGPDEDDDVVDQRVYRSMIGSLLYLTAIRPDIQFIMCLCARFQDSPRSSHWMAVQRIFRYLKHTLVFRIWYSASYSLDLVGFFDADFTSCGIDHKITSGT
jgi:hypothetical protein